MKNNEVQIMKFVTTSRTLEFQCYSIESLGLNYKTEISESLNCFTSCHWTFIIKKIISNEE